MSFRSLLLPRILCAFILVLLTQNCHAQAPEAAQKAPEKKTEPAAAVEPQLPARIELLETHVRFETNGDSRKEVHTRVRINNELGVRQFARLNFDYNRSFESIEIPFVRITHASGGTADILPGAITDNPNPAVVDAPAYQDVRVKSVRILGLEPGDVLEYRVITAVYHPPFAPNFYLSHDFATEDIAERELFEVELPASSVVSTSTSQRAREFETEKSGEGDAARVIYRWKRTASAREQKPNGQPPAPKQSNVDLPLFSDSDVAISSFPSWADALKALQRRFSGVQQPDETLQTKAKELAGSVSTPREKLRALYDFVAQKIATIDLAPGTTGYLVRAPNEILSSGYAVPEDKCLLLAALAFAVQIEAQPVSVVGTVRAERPPVLPSAFINTLVLAYVEKTPIWMDPSSEVAPFGMIAANLRDKPALLPYPRSDVRFFEDVPKDLPFAASQRVSVTGSLTSDGSLAVKVRYILRGDNELLLRVAFHQTAKEKWKDVAQLLALSDGFRGKVTSVTASDPLATKDPFTVEYEIEQPKFVDWSKKPVRIPALLPQVSLPDPPAKPAPGAPAAPIELGTPLDVETHATLRLPSGTTARVPTGASVERDYATFASKYSANGLTLTASRHVNFLLREVPAARIADYNAFLHAVQSDQTQDFTLERAESSPAQTQPATHKPAPEDKP